MLEINSDSSKRIRFDHENVTFWTKKMDKIIFEDFLTFLHQDIKETNYILIHSISANGSCQQTIGYNKSKNICYMFSVYEISEKYEDALQFEIPRRENFSEFAAGSIRIDISMQEMIDAIEKYVNSYL